MEHMATQLNNAQRDAVEYTDNPLLIVAGAGTGKTTVITEKIAFLVEKKNIPSQNIVALTFNDHAAKEMQERVEMRLQNSYTDITISTFHAFCQTILEQYGLDIGMSTSFKLLTEVDAWMLMRRHLHTFSLDYYRPLGNPSKHIHELLAHFSKCQDELVSPEEYLRYAESLVLDSDTALGAEKNRVTEIAHAYHRYTQLLLDEQAVDFSGLMYYTVKLLRERPNVLAELQSRYHYILVDEFQDVNWAQYQLVCLLAGDRAGLTVVGDDDQSIYAFRGASVANILRFRDDFPKAKYIVLNENYRSGQKILDTAYASIQHNNPERLEVKLSIDKRLVVGTKEQGDGVVTHLHAPTLEEEVAQTVAEIRRLHDVEHVSWDDMAILVRANAHADPFLQALSSAQVPYEFVASVGLYRQPIVMDIINFFKVVDNYHESAAVYRLLRMPCFSVGEKDLQQLTAMAKKKSVWYFDALERAQEFHLSPEGIETSAKIVSLIRAAVGRAKREKPTRVLYKFLEDSGYLSYLTQEEQKGNQIIIRQVYQLQQFFSLLSSYEEVHKDAHISDYLEYYRQSIDAGDGGELYQVEETPDSVQVMTVHAAKGLEFPYVFVVNMVEERFPTRPRGESLPLPDVLVKEGRQNTERHYEEERRLLYVAMTRAKTRLYLTSADDYGGARAKKTSRFLGEIGYAQEAVRKKEMSVAKKFIDHHGADISAGSDAAMYPLPKSFSFSQIKSYETCPYQYKLAHILKIPTKSNASLSFGQSIHMTLQRFYERVQELNRATQASLFSIDVPSTAKEASVKVPSLQELVSLYEASWIDDWYESRRQREEYYKKGKEILTLFYTSHEGHWHVPHALETPFTIMVGRHKIRGRIDRVDQLPDGTLEIIDYKTGKSKEKLIGDDKEQLLIYQIAATTLPQYRNIGRVAKLTFYYLNDNIKTTFVGADKELIKLKEKLEETIQRIHERVFDATPSAHVCGRCDFRDVCEYRAV